MRTHHAKMRQDSLLFSFPSVFFPGCLPSRAVPSLPLCVCSCMNSGQVQNPLISLFIIGTGNVLINTSQEIATNVAYDLMLLSVMVETVFA